MKLTTPSRTLLQGKPYTPSWLMPQTTRYMTQRLQGRYGLTVPTIPEGTKSADPHDELERPA
jgi:hypothetical protein